MRLSSLSALAALAIVCSAVDTGHDTEAPPLLRKTVSYGLSRATRAARVPDDVLKAPIVKFMGGISYNMDINIGTPPQSIAVAFDTGSSDLVVNSHSTSFCQSGACLFGALDGNASSTFKTINTHMSMEYAAGLFTGQWATDTVQIQGSTLPEFVVGVGDKSSKVPQNILGVGFPSNRMSKPELRNPTDITTVGAMVKAGLIKSESFSVYLNDDTNANGSVVFGGVDRSNYNGQLQTYPMVPNDQEIYDRLAVDVSSISVDGIKTKSSMRTLIDTGEPDIRLPKDFVDEVWKAHGVIGVPFGNPDLKMSLGLIKCTMADSPLTVDVVLPGLEISIPFKDLVFKPSPELITSFGMKPSDLPKGICLFNLNHEIKGLVILGIPFLQSTYAVFNLETQEISMAPINRKPGPSDIKEIKGSLKSSPVSGHQIRSTASEHTNSSASSTPSPFPLAGAASQLRSWSGPAMFGLLCTIVLIF